MCRVLAYMGPPTSVDDLLYRPDSSLIRQTYEPRLHFLLNLAGFGLTAWDPSSHDPDTPFTYRIPEIPVFDRNLAAVRYSFDFGRLAPVHLAWSDYTYRSLWFTTGKSYGYHQGEWKMTGGLEHSDAVILSSEPLTKDVTTWLELPEYSMLVIHRNGDGVQHIRSFAIDV